MFQFSFFSGVLFFLSFSFLPATELSFERLNETSGSQQTVEGLTSGKYYQPSVSQTGIVSDIPVTPLNSFFESAIIIRESLLGSFFEKQGGVIADSVIAEQMTQLENLISELDSESSTPARRFLDSLSLAVEKSRNGELDLSVLAQNLDDLNALLLENGRFPRLDSSLLCRISEEQLGEFTILVQEFSQQLESESVTALLLQEKSRIIGGMFRMLFPENRNKIIVDFFIHNLHEITSEPLFDRASSAQKDFFLQALSYYPQGITEHSKIRQENKFYGTVTEVSNRHEPIKSYYINWERSNFALDLPWVSAQEVTISHDIKLVSAFVSSMSKSYWPQPDLRLVDSISTEMISWAVPHAAEGQMGGVLYYNSWPYPVITPIKNVRQGESLRISVKYPASWRTDGVHQPFLSAGKWYVTLMKLPTAHTDFARYYDRSDFVGKVFGIIDVLSSEAEAPAVKITKIELFSQNSSLPSVAAKNGAADKINPFQSLRGRIHLEQTRDERNDYKLGLLLQSEGKIVSVVKEWDIKSSDFRAASQKLIDFEIASGELLKLLQDAEAHNIVIAKLSRKSDNTGPYTEKSLDLKIMNIFVKNWLNCQNKAPEVEMNTTHFGATKEHPLFPEVVRCKFELVDEKGNKFKISSAISGVNVRERIDHLYSEAEPIQLPSQKKAERRLYGFLQSPDNLEVVSTEHPSPGLYPLKTDASFDVKFESYAFFPKNIPDEDSPRYEIPLKGQIVFELPIPGNTRKVPLSLYPNDPGIKNNWQEEALQTGTMVMYRQWETIEFAGLKIPAWLAKRLNFYLKKMDSHPEIFLVTKYLKFKVGLDFDRPVHENAVEWKIDARHLYQAAGVASSGLKKISFNPYSWYMRRNGDWWAEQHSFFHKDAYLGGKHSFFATLLHEFRHAYQNYLTEKLSNSDADGLIAGTELKKIAGARSGKFCLFGNSSNGICSYDPNNEGHILQSKVKKWSDIDHGFLIDPKNSDYTITDFNLLPNSRFKDGVKDEYRVNGLTDVYAAREAEAHLFEWWFHTLPEPENLPETPIPPETLPETPPDTGSPPPPVIPPGTPVPPGSTPPSNIPVPEVVFNGLNAYGTAAFYSTANLPHGATIQGENVFINPPRGFGFSFDRRYWSCTKVYGSGAGRVLNSTSKCGAVRFIWKNGAIEKTGPWRQVCHTFSGLEMYPFPANEWRCR